MERFVEVFLAIEGPWAVAATFLAPALETALILGLVLPGELTVILGGVLAGRGQVPLIAVLSASVSGAIAGDVAGYLIGRKYGQEIMRQRLKGKWARAHGWLSKKGGGTVFLGRFLPFLRSVLPTTAGAMRVPARRFFPWDVPAAIVWGAASTLLGYFVARDLERLFELALRFSLGLATLALVLLTLAVWRRMKRRRKAPARLSILNRLFPQQARRRTGS